MTTRSLILRGLLAVAATPMVLDVPPAAAQGSCQQLWYARNAIYARNGYCFQTQRGINTFGRGCFPPYGRMSRAEQREVNRLQAIEYRRGCPR